jgi:hypothetical protein
MINEAITKTIKLFRNKKLRIAPATKIILTPISITQKQILSSLPKSHLNCRLQNIVKT